MAENKHAGSSLDDFLREEGVLEEFQAVAIKEVIAWQLQKAMADMGLSKRKLALLMKTSRTQVDRVLDPKDGNVTIATLQRAAMVIGRKVSLSLI
jgi:antitoxin HicB